MTSNTTKNKKNNKNPDFRKGEGKRRPGEGQRKDGRYYYRYTDTHGKRQTIYDWDLTELRRKEAEIQLQISEGIDYAAGKISVNELIRRYASLKQGVAEQTKKWYEDMWKPRQNDKFCQRAINTVKPSDVKQWFIQLNDQGLSYKSLNGLKAILKPAFQMACDEDVIRKNPCAFKLNDVVANDTKPKFALTKQQQMLWLNFIKNDKVYAKYYDLFVVMMRTGLRVSELCGLTRKDLDFEQGQISVNHQLLYIAKRGFSVADLKTQNSKRQIPMSDEVYASLQNLLANRPKLKKEVMIDGYSEFIFIHENGNPYDRNFVGKLTGRILKKYNASHVEQLPKISPHIFRHTFCTDMANSTVNVKALQYVMGHADISTTLGVYAHADLDMVNTEMAKVIDLPAAIARKKAAI